jgi:hypothetical protein
MFRSKKMRGFFGVVVLLMIGLTVWLVVAKPSVVSNQDKTEVAKTDKADQKETPTSGKNQPAKQPAKESAQDDNLDMPGELTTTGGIDVATPITLAGVVFSTTGYMRSKRLLSKKP